MTAGRKPLPGRVHQLHGNPSKLPMGRLLDEFTPPAELAEAPEWLKADGLEEYQRLGQQLEQLGVIAAIDRGVLAGACVEWGRYVWAERKIAELNAADPEGERGLVDKTPNDYKVQSVYLQISRKSFELYVKTVVEFGCTPSARTRVKPLDAPQLTLPGIEAANEAQPGRITLRSFA